jgi:hypothetical protein
MSKSNPLDASVSEEVEESTASDEDNLTHYLAGLAFQPKAPRAKGTLEYVKTYSSPSGDVARVLLVVKKDEVGLTPQSVDSIVVTIQLDIPATETAVRARVPSFCKADVLRVLAHFGDQNTRSEVDVIECKSCGLVVANYLAVEDASICHDCARRRGIM